MDDRLTLITQLCAELDHCRRILLDDRQVTHPLADRARAVLARWGHQSALPDEGEVAEVVRWLRSLEDASVWFESGSPEALKLTRAADLLERLASHACVVLKPSPGLIEAFKGLPPGRIEPLLAQRHPAPVLVSERLPGAEDCDAEGRCWWLLLEHQCDAMWCESPIVTHWLPATALSVPQGEGQ